MLLTSFAWNKLKVIGFERKNTELQIYKSVDGYVILKILGS